MYRAIDEYRKGKRGRPRFKKRKRFFSIEGKSNITGIRFKENKLHYKNLILDVVLDKKDPYQIQAHALLSKVKYCRLIKQSKKFTGRKRDKNKNWLA